MSWRAPYKLRSRPSTPGPAPPPAAPTRRGLIAQELASFMGVYDSAEAIAADVPGALAQLTENLGT
jgi:hypothetical protein